MEATHANGNGSGDSPSPAELFALIWNSLADLLGTAATSALLRRAIRRAAPRAPELEAVVVSREGLAYGYRLPDAWLRLDPAVDVDQVPGPLTALRELMSELLPLLLDLTGRVAAQRLARLAPLRERGVVTSEELELCSLSPA